MRHGISRESLEPLKFDANRIKSDSFAGTLRHRGVKGAVVAFSSRHWVFNQPSFEFQAMTSALP